MKIQHVVRAGKKYTIPARKVAGPSKRQTVLKFTLGCGGPSSSDYHEHLILLKCVELGRALYQAGLIPFTHGFEETCTEFIKAMMDWHDNEIRLPAEDK